jgi:hypothetical protein
MPVLDAAMSPSAIIGMIESWPYLNTMGISIEGGEVKKVRPKENGKLEVEYQFEMVNSTTAETFTATVLGKFYPDDKAEKKYRKLLENLRGSEYFAAGSTLRGFAVYFADGSLRGFAFYIPELRLLLQTPLEDKKLPGLETALDHEQMKPFLAGYLNPGRPGLESIRTCTVDILRYKPGKRCALRYRFSYDGSDSTGNVAIAGQSASRMAGESHVGEGSKPSQRSLIGKIYGDGQEGARIFGIMSELARRGFDWGAADGIKIPHPYGYIPGLQMVVMEDVPSPSLKEMLSVPELDQHLQRAARALLKIHHCPLGVVRRQRVTRKFQVEGRVSIVKQAVSKAVKACPALRMPFKASMSGIKELSRGIFCPQPTLIHGSLYLAEFLVGENEMTIVDFDTFCNADPAIDVGNFLGHLRWKGLQLEWSPEEARRHAQTFLTAYRSDLPPDLTCRIDFYTRLALLRIAARVALQPRNLALASGLLEATMQDYSFERGPRVW